MNRQGRISGGQLLLLLFLSRAFTLVAYSPRVRAGGGSITLLTTLLSGVLQWGVLAAGLFFCRRSSGLSPLAAPGTGFFRLQSGFYWLLAMAFCVQGAAGFLSFLVTEVYDYRDGWMVGLTFAGAAALAALQGLEGLARGAGVLAALLGLGCAAVALGLWQEYDWLNFSWRLLPPEETARGVWQAAAMNGELLAALLLLPRLRRAPGKGAWAGWVGGVALASGAVQLMTMLTLGAYGARKPFPVFTAVTAAGFSAFQRLDPVFLALWVILGLVRTALFLGIAAGLSAGIFFRAPGAGWVWGNAALAGGLALALFSREGWLEGLQEMLASGAPLLGGALLLPALGWFLDRRGRRAQP